MPLQFLIGGDKASPLSVRTYKKCFCVTSFETIGVFEYYFMHRYMIIKYTGQVRLRVKSTHYYQRYGPFSCMENGFKAITFEYIGILDSYFIHRFI